MLLGPYIWVLSAAVCMCCAATSDIDLLMRDARIVHDVAELRFDAGAPDASWVLVKITPSESSGSATIPGATIDGTTGNGTRSGQTSILEEGSWRLVQVLDPYKGPQQGTYSWLRPVRTHEKAVSPDDVYAPFSKDGTVACRLSDRLPSAAMFQSPFLIPAGWEKEVSTAYREFKKGPDHITAQTSGNILALMSFRAWAARGMIGIKRLDRELSGSRGYERSALIYLVLTLRPAGMDALIESELKRLVMRSSVDERRAIALGLFAARTFHRELYSDRLAQSLVTTLLKTSMHPPDIYLSRILLGS